MTQGYTCRPTPTTLLVMSARGGGSTRDLQAREVIAQSVFRVPSYATGSRPTGIVAGAMVYDSTLGKPIWYTGSVWKDAAGTTV